MNLWHWHCLIFIIYTTNSPILTVWHSEWTRIYILIPSGTRPVYALRFASTIHIYRLARESCWDLSKVLMDSLCIARHKAIPLNKYTLWHTCMHAMHMFVCDDIMLLAVLRYLKRELHDTPYIPYTTSSRVYTYATHVSC